MNGIKKIPDITTVKNKIMQECIDYIVNKDWREWYYDECPYDYSGCTKLIKTPKEEYIQNIDVDEHLHPLDYIYTGETTATHTSHYGLHHVSLSDVVQENYENEILGAFIQVNIDENLEPDTEEYDEKYEELIDEFYSNPEVYGLSEIETLIEIFTKDYIINLLKSNN